MPYLDGYFMCVRARSAGYNFHPGWNPGPEEFSMTKWCKLAFHFSWPTSFWNQRWPLSAILDMFWPSKFTWSASKLPDELHYDHFWSSMIACNVCKKGFVSNQSITGSHLEKRQNGRNNLLNGSIVSQRWVWYDKMMQTYVLFQLTDIFPKSKMAAVSHIGCVLTFKIHLICIEITRGT